MRIQNPTTTAYGHTCTIDNFDTRLLLSGKEKVTYTIPQDFFLVLWPCPAHNALRK